jgi:hypothetical protein
VICSLIAANGAQLEKGMIMTRLGASMIWMLLLVSAAFAQDGVLDRDGIHYAHIAVTALGLLFAIRMADQAFGRRALQLADSPTFPRYMTSRGQYLLGSWTFIVLATFIFLLIVYLHKEVADVAKLLGEPLSKDIIEAVQNDHASYLIIIFAMGSVYLFLLKKEAEWNVLLMIRDLIHTWISVPQRGRKIVDEISLALTVPDQAVNNVVSSSIGVAPADFRKDRRTVDRLWAEICYMHVWIYQQQSAGDDATFFTEPSFGLDQLVGQRDKVAWLVRILKAGEALPAPNTSETIYNELRAIHLKFARLIGCYLLYRNGSRQRLASEARKFGVPFKDEHVDNPLRYSVIYLLTVSVAVYISVYGSAILYDVFAGKGLLFAFSNQDAERVFSWIMYSLSNYGLAIVAVLMVRLLIWKVTETGSQSYLLTYCWTFLLACVMGALGLTLAAKFNGASSVDSLSYVQTFTKMLQWSIGSGLVAVCITYFMDRQLSSDLPDIDTSIVARRIVNSVIFAVFTIVLQLPPLLALDASADASWDGNKLRCVAVGATFVVTVSLALVSQFGLRSSQGPALSRAPQAAE